MKKIRSFIVGTAILTVATGAVMSSPLATFAQNESPGKGGFAHRARMHRMSGAGAPLISIALKHRTELNLSNEQVAGLETILFNSSCVASRARSRNCASKARRT
jgi:hypothetical protein